VGMDMEMGEAHNVKIQILNVKSNPNVQNIK